MNVFFKKKEKEDNKAFRQLMQQRLVEVVENHAQENGSPDVATVTGDIAFSGKEQEYEEAAEFFKKLKKVLPEEIEFLEINYLALYPAAYFYCRKIAEKIIK